MQLARLPVPCGPLALGCRASLVRPVELRNRSRQVGRQGKQVLPHVTMSLHHPSTPPPPAPRPSPAAPVRPPSVSKVRAEAPRAHSLRPGSLHLASPQQARDGDPCRPGPALRPPTSPRRPAGRGREPPTLLSFAILSFAILSLVSLPRTRRDPFQKILKDVCARVGLPRGTRCLPPSPQQLAPPRVPHPLTPHQPLGTENPRAAVLTQRVPENRARSHSVFFKFTETHQMALGQTVAGKAVD